MGRRKQLFKNTLILGIGQLSSKVFTFLLLPIYTSLLSPDDFGNIDAIQTVLSLSMYFITLQIENSIFRFLIESRNDKLNEEGYITSGFFIIIIMSSIFSVILLGVNTIYKIQYLYIILFLIWVQPFYLYCSNIARGLGKNLDYSIGSFIVTITSLIVNILLILVYGMGAVSIIIALLISNLIGTLFYFIKLRIREYINTELIKLKVIKSMLNYSIPLIPNAVSWWIANASDRIFILVYLGVSFNGIYAAANKIPTIYTTVFNVFNIAWSESVSLAINDSDRDKYINNITKNIVYIFLNVNLLIILASSIFFKFLIGVEYTQAYNHIFILLISLYINSICSILGGILTGLMNTKAIGLTTLVGACVNAIINILFIKQIGLYAASISTLISYLVILFFRYKEVNKEIHLKLSFSYFSKCLIMITIVGIGYFYNNLILNCMLAIFIVLYNWLSNREMIVSMFYKYKYEKRS